MKPIPHTIELAIEALTEELAPGFFLPPSAMILRNGEPESMVVSHKSIQNISQASGFSKRIVDEIGKCNADMVLLVIPTRNGDEAPELSFSVQTATDHWIGAAPILEPTKGMAFGPIRWEHNTKPAAFTMVFPQSSYSPSVN